MVEIQRGALRTLEQHALPGIESVGNLRPGVGSDREQALTQT